MQVPTYSLKPTSSYIRDYECIAQGHKQVNFLFPI